MIGLLIDTETGDMSIAGGRAIAGEIANQCAEQVLVGMRGEWKEYPLLGGEAGLLRGGSRDVMWPGRVKKMLRSCDLAVNRVEVSDTGIITIS